MMFRWIARVLGGAETGRGNGALIERTRRAESGVILSSMVDSADRLAAEIDRARRYEHALSIVVLWAAPLVEGSERRNGSSGAPEREPTFETCLPQVVSLLAAGALRDLVRGSDIVCYRPSEDRFVLALAESDVHDAQKALHRIEELFGTRLRLRVRAGLARFPDDGLTLEDLVAAAAARAATGAPARPRLALEANGIPRAESGVAS